jgi:hypothetical protein
MDEASLSVANGVLYAGSFDPAGHMYALNAANGKILWSFASGGSVLGGPAIVKGVVYWGSGYVKVGGTGNNKVFAFAPFTVSGPIVAVTAPTNNSQLASPVHYVASAGSPNCAKGIASMRIYTAPGVVAYSAKSAQINTNIPLSPGAYNTIVQAFDNCGRVGKTPVKITVK